MDECYSAICVVIVNWNNSSDTKNCIRNLRKHAKVRLIVVDNGSTDQSVHHLSDLLNANEFIRSEKNLGFGGGNNLGIRAALAEGYQWIWLLNNDTLVQPDSLSEMLKSTKNGEYSIVGSRLMYMSEPNSIQSLGGGYLKNFTFSSHHIKSVEEIAKLEYITAASMLVNAGVFSRIGLFDERIFLYWEDVDFSFRARRAGFKLSVAFNSVILHKESATSQKLGMIRQKYYTQGLTLFLQHNFSYGRLLAIYVNTLRTIVKMLRFDFKSAFLIAKFGILFIIFPYFDSEIDSRVHKSV